MRMLQIYRNHFFCSSIPPTESRFDFRHSVYLNKFVAPVKATFKLLSGKCKLLVPQGQVALVSAFVLLLPDKFVFKF